MNSRSAFTNSGLWVARRSRVSVVPSMTTSVRAGKMTFDSLDYHFDDHHAPGFWEFWFEEIYS